MLRRARDGGGGGGPHLQPAGAAAGQLLHVLRVRHRGRGRGAGALLLAHRGGRRARGVRAARALAQRRARVLLRRLRRVRGARRLPDQRRRQVALQEPLPLEQRSGSDSFSFVTRLP